MALIFEVNKKEHEIKFDYRMVFKANKELSSKNPETGESNGDGALNLFNQINDGLDEGVINLLKLKAGKNTTENMAVDAMAKYVENLELDDEDAFNQLFEDVKEEMLNSGFFVGRLKKQIEQMERNANLIKKHGTDEQKDQIEILNETIETVKKEIY